MSKYITCPTCQGKAHFRRTFQSTKTAMTEKYYCNCEVCEGTGIVPRVEVEK